MKILLVEDEKNIRETMSMLLKTQGHEVVEHSGGVAAFEEFKNNTFDLILSDVRMPDGSGDQLLKNVRETNKEIPFIIMTGYSELDFDQLYELGANEVLSKPFDPGMFFESLKKYSNK